MERLWAWTLARPGEEWSVPRVPAQAPPEDDGRIGICCSGGGIRSAAYNLGALQVLREEGVLGGAEYLAAVSGGSYIAAAHLATLSSSPPLPKEKPVFGPGSPEEEH